MNWKKRKKLRKIAHAHGKSHYYEWRSVIKALCHLDLYMTYCREKRSKAWRVLVSKKMQDKECHFDLSKLCESVKSYDGPIAPTYDWEFFPPEVIGPLLDKYCEQMIRYSKERSATHECASEKETIKP